MARITAELVSGTVVEITNGRHRWRADEPPEAQGTDEGPNPYELLLGALGACTCITLALYCRHKRIALKSVSAAFEHDRTHAEDCVDCDKPETGFIDRIRTDVRIAGEFDDAQRKRLAEVAARCPVHKTLGHGVKIEDHVRFV